MSVGSMMILTIRMAPLYTYESKVTLGLNRAQDYAGGQRQQGDRCVTRSLVDGTNAGPQGYPLHLDLRSVLTLLWALSQLPLAFDTPLSVVQCSHIFESSNSAYASCTAGEHSTPARNYIKPAPALPTPCTILRLIPVSQAPDHRHKLF